MRCVSRRRGRLHHEFAARGRARCSGFCRRTARRMGRTLSRMRLCRGVRVAMGRLRRMGRAGMRAGLVRPGMRRRMTAAVMRCLRMRSGRPRLRVRFALRLAGVIPAFRGMRTLSRVRPGTRLRLLHTRCPRAPA